MAVVVTKVVVDLALPRMAGAECGPVAVAVVLWMESWPRAMGLLEENEDEEEDEEEEAAAAAAAGRVGGEAPLP